MHLVRGARFARRRTNGSAATWSEISRASGGCFYVPSAELKRAARPLDSGDARLVRGKGASMSPKFFLAVMVLSIVAGYVLLDHRDASAGEVIANSEYKVLDPIRHGNLTVFPVVAAKSYPTSEFLTLDEGLRSGEVIVTESGSVQGLIRRHPPAGIRRDGAEVNRLVLVNNSKRPLLLLAGEVVSGGKQDRVIGKDR